MKKPLVLALILFGVDQISKYIVNTFVDYGSSISIIKSYSLFNITNVHNTGVAFSFFQGKNFLFSIFTAVVLLFFCVWLYKNKNGISKMQLYAFCLVISGGFGNLIDRIFRGAVVDFLDFGVNALRWPSFNVADSCICIGAFVIVLDIVMSLFQKKKA